MYMYIITHVRQRVFMLQASFFYGAVLRISEAIFVVGKLAMRITSNSVQSDLISQVKLIFGGKSYSL